MRHPRRYNIHSRCLIWLFKPCKAIAWETMLMLMPQQCDSKLVRDRMMACLQMMWAHC